MPSVNCCADQLRNLGAVEARNCSVIYGYVDRYHSAMDQLQDSLVPEELQRADRFRFAADRTRFIVRRGVLRIALAERLQCAPAEVRFSYNRFGKPKLSGNNGENLSFSSTASGGMFAIAISHSPVGIDLEYVNFDVDMLAIADRVFPAPVVALLHSIEPEAQPSFFFKCWTRAEAYIKAQGVGLSQLLPDLISPHLFVDRRGLIFCQESGQTRYEIEDLALANDCATAVVTTQSLSC